MTLPVPIEGGLDRAMMDDSGQDPVATIGTTNEDLQAMFKADLDRLAGDDLSPAALGNKIAKLKKAFDDFDKARSGIMSQASQRESYKGNGPIDRMLETSPVELRESVNPQSFASRIRGYVERKPQR